MKLKVRAHFDGQVFVPDEPVTLAKDHRVSLIVSDEIPQAGTTAERLAALDRLASRAVRGANIPDEALRREHLYEDR